MNIRGWFPLGLTGLSSLLSKGLLRVFSTTTIQKHQFFSAQPSLWSNSHIHTWLLEKLWFLPYEPLSAKWCLCFFIILFRFVIAFLPRSQHLLFSWLKSLSTVILEPKKTKSATVSTLSPSICHEMMGPDAMILVFECWVLPASRGSLVSLHFLPSKWYYLHIWGCWYFSWQSWFRFVIHPAQHFTWCTLHRG